jgi:hypothetical protein
VDRLWEYINCSQIHECGNWEQGCAVSFLGIHKSDLVCSAYLLSEMFFFKKYFSMLCCLIFLVTRQMEALTREYLNIKTGFADNK